MGFIWVHSVDVHHEMTSCLQVERNWHVDLFVKANAKSVAGYGELVASLQRLQLQLKKNGLSQGPGGYTSLEGQIAAVQTLLLSPEFGRALAIHNRVQEVWNQWHPLPSGGSKQPATAPSPVSTHAQTLVRDVSLFSNVFNLSQLILYVGMNAHRISAGKHLGRRPHFLRNRQKR